MKTRTKLLTALLSTVTALSCALTAAAATTPSIELQGNEATPVTLGMTAEAQKATVTLKATDFATVGGADITLTLPNGITFNSATVTNATTGSTWTLAKDENYKVDLENKKIKFVDVFNLATDNSDKLENVELNITFDVKTADIGTYEIGVSAKLANTDATEMAATTKVGNIVIGRKQNTYTSDFDKINEDLTTGEFIPLGGAYTENAGNYTYYTKNENGTIDFTGATSVTVLKCMLPTEKRVTTFGASPSMINDANKGSSIQFGSFALKDSGKKYGTLIIVGDFEEYKKVKGYTDEKAFARWAKGYDKYLEKNPSIANEGDYIYETYDTDKKIYIAKVPQSRKMWENNEQLQYALRIVGITNSNETYTAVAYSKDTSYVFSNEYHNASLSSLGVTEQ